MTGGQEEVYPSQTMALLLQSVEQLRFKSTDGMAIPGFSEVMILMQKYPLISSVLSHSRMTVTLSPLAQAETMAMIQSIQESMATMLAMYEFSSGMAMGGSNAVTTLMETASASRVVTLFL